MTEPSPGERAPTWLERSWATLESAARQHVWWFALGGLVFVGVVVTVVVARSSGDDAPRAAAPRVAAPPGAAADDDPGELDTSDEAPAATAPAALAPPSASAPPAVAPAAPVADAGAPRSPTVKVVFKTYPPRRATVMWGGKRLGVIDRGKPLVVERPRDSGPIDVVIRAPGYLPVHARAVTFDDTTLEVRITPVDKKDTIYGYQEPIPPDAGAPP